jgi:hypothetical protein
LTLNDPKFDIGIALQMPQRPRTPELVKTEAEAMIATDNVLIEDQHVISRVLLKRFSASVNGRQKVCSYKILTGTSRPTSLDTAGMIPNFLAVASGSAEKIWKSVEDRLGDAIDAATSPQELTMRHQAVIKDAIALHYARSDAVRQLGGDIYGQLRAHFKRWLTGRFRPALQDLFYSQMGFYAGDFQTLDSELLDPLFRDVDELMLSGKWRRVRIQQLFDDTRALIQPASIAVLRSTGQDFIIGDVPVVTRTNSPEQAAHGVLGGLPIGAAKQVFFPIRPDRAVCLSDSNHWISLSNGEVQEFNALQSKLAIDRIFYRPGLSIESDLRRIRPPTQGPYANA